MKKIKTDSVFVVEQPKRSGTALIFVDNEGPLSPGEHDRLFKLSEVANLFFVAFDATKAIKEDLFETECLFGGQMKTFMQVFNANGGVAVFVLYFGSCANCFFH